MRISICLVVLNGTFYAGLEGFLRGTNYANCICLVRKES